MHCPRHRLRGTLSLGLGSLATGIIREIDLVQRRWQIGEGGGGTRPSRLAMNKAAINVAIIREVIKKA